MKKVGGKNGYIALMATIIISLILLIITVEEGSAGWYARFNILGTEAKEQANSLAEGCAEQAIAKLLTDPTYNGSSTTTYPGGSCYTFPVELDTPSPGLLTLKTQAEVRNSYTNLNITLHKNNILYGNTGFVSASLSSPDIGGDNNGFEISPNKAFTDETNGIPGAAQNVDGSGDKHKFYGYNFGLSPSTTITGIQVRLEWWLNSINGTNSIDAELSWDGGLNWTQIKTATNESISISNYSILGGPGDNWGHAWTSNDNFVLRITTNSTVASRDFYLDWIAVKVNYLNTINNTPNGNFFITPIETWKEVPSL